MTFRSAVRCSPVSAKSKGLEAALSWVMGLPFPMSYSVRSPKTVWAPILKPLPSPPLPLLLLVATPFFLQFFLPSASLKARHSDL